MRRADRLRSARRNAVGRAADTLARLRGLDRALSLALLRFVARRVTAGALLVLGVLTLTFVLVEAAPGTAADLVAAERPLPPEARARLEAAFGLDRPPLARYGTWIAGALRGDLGWSISRGRPVAQVVASALPADALLAWLALAAASGRVHLGTLHVSSRA